MSAQSLTAPEVAAIAARDRVVWPQVAQVIAEYRRANPTGPLPDALAAAEDRHRLLDDLTVRSAAIVELQATFDLRWNADRRATERWQRAHPGRENVWPDHADMVVWLLEQLEGDRR